jgi:hypothetical protein
VQLLRLIQAVTQDGDLTAQGRQLFDGVHPVLALLEHGMLDGMDDDRV